MTKTNDLQHYLDSVPDPQYDMSLLKDCFQEGKHNPCDMAAHMRAVCSVLGQALAVLHNNGIKFKVDPLAIAGFETIETLALFIDQLDRYPLEEVKP